MWYLDTARQRLRPDMRRKLPAIESETQSCSQPFLALSVQNHNLAFAISPFAPGFSSPMKTPRGIGGYGGSAEGNRGGNDINNLRTTEDAWRFTVEYRYINELRTTEGNRGGAISVFTFHINIARYTNYLSGPV